RFSPLSSFGAETVPREVMRHWSHERGYAVCWELVSQKPIRRRSPEARVSGAATLRRGWSTTYRCSRTYSKRQNA
ncbi:hypothetical protein NKI31_31505, partial [Mesorhizobium sp. M0659]|uniref:hypothetical protein n=1 Tax=Mesorhizobium sp. M0659 TaxID=2956980 RepID=UPI003335DB49